MKLPADKVNQLRTFYEGRGVCVTGGAGFIGGHLCDALLSLGAQIRVIDDLSNSTLEHLSTLIELEPDRVRFVHGSILDDDALAEAIDGSRCVFHLAALGSVPRSIEDPQRTWSVNTTGTLRVLQAARGVGRPGRAALPRADRVVLASSSSVYGDNPTLPRHESHAPRPLSPYAASKLACESLAAVYSSSYGLSTASLRFFNIFGPRQSADSAYAAVIPAFVRKLMDGESPVIYGDGESTRDFTFVSSAVLGLLLAGASTRPLAGEAMNIGTGRAVSIAQLAAMLAEHMGTPQTLPRFEPSRQGDVSHSVADTDLARSLIGYVPVADLESGLGETVEWFRRTLASS
jgi:UDP-glucose 4-epimerase